LQPTSEIKNILHWRKEKGEIPMKKIRARLDISRAGRVPLDYTGATGADGASAVITWKTGAFGLPLGSTTKA